MEHSEIKDNTNLKRFEMRTGNHVSFIDYRLEGDNRIALLHTEVPSELKGGGVATALLTKVLDQISEQQMKVVPACSFVIRHFERHPEKHSLLASK